jgi:type I restriction enzyme S subunit
MENELLDNTIQEMEYIGDIPEGWKWVKLGELLNSGICELLDRYRIPLSDNQRNKMKNGILYPYYGANGIIDYVNSYIFDGQFILVAEDGTVSTDKGKPVVQYVCGKFWVSNHAHVIKCENSITLKFLYYVLRNVDIIPYITGAVQPKLNQRNLLDIEILYALDINEQKAITDVLSSIDDKIELLHRQNKTLEEMAMTLFRQWFIEPTKDGLPDGWEEISLGDSDLSKIIPSGIKKFEGFKTYLATGDVEGTLIKGGVEITYNNRPSRANMQPEKYSVWFAKKEGVRKLLMFDDYSDTDKYILSTGFTGLKTNELSHYYIWCFILSEDFQDIKDSLVSGSVQPDIPNEAVLQIFIPRPPNEVLLSFNEKVKPLFTKIQFNTSQIQTLEKLRDTLLPKLMSGEIRVKI